ncbi:hypothetical protein CSIV_15895 [Microbacterium sp. CSI-V]|uniref:type IV toxin-antitoxin system AbiEi family antitoxin domain-containing protein n=1 Tax=unclassified Microbacterium TaxID=2609290 RepID=UPI00097C89D9|nr:MULTISPECIES: hypothetical protein [unclassified Microbacterium]MXS74298.1 hypothetical protein [Microbacterium sp. TL13]ONI62920.1 hypothetical protein CSIV_15895 [Microbacterium sp. CSI-V]
MDAVPRSLRASPTPLLLVSDTPRSGPPPWRDESLWRVRAGVYVIRAEWEALPPWERYLVRVHAFALARPDAVFSHEAAASLLGLPVFGHPRTIHIFDARRSRSARYGDVTVHTSADRRSQHEVAGIRISAVEDVAIDLARVLPPALGLAVADAALRAFDLDGELLLDRAATQRNEFGRRRLRWVLSHATPLAESPGESISRAVIEWCGFPTPELQRNHRVEGRIFRSDFCWPERKILGESDGWLKYGADDPAAAAAAVRAEKYREDALRRQGWRIARWDYAGALGVAGLRNALTAAGLRPERHPETAALSSVGRNARST